VLQQLKRTCVGPYPSTAEFDTYCSGAIGPVRGFFFFFFLFFVLLAVDIVRYDYVQLSGLQTMSRSGTDTQLACFPL
jgi:hypothetical protein